MERLNIELQIIASWSIALQHVQAVDCSSDRMCHVINLMIK